MKHLPAYAHSAAGVDQWVINWFVNGGKGKVEEVRNPLLPFGPYLLGSQLIQWQQLVMCVLYRSEGGGGSAIRTRYSNDMPCGTCSKFYASKVEKFGGKKRALFVHESDGLDDGC